MECPTMNIVQVFNGFLYYAVSSDANQLLRIVFLHCQHCVTLTTVANTSAMFTVTFDVEC